MSREEDIEQWMLSHGVAKDRRKRIIPSSTDKITHQPLGSGLDAMAKIAQFAGDRPELPIVELGQIKESSINLTFAAPVELPEPFYALVENDPTQWTIDTEDALYLETGESYGWQLSALTSLGNGPTGGKILLNTARWEVLGSAGMASFTTGLLIGQVMEQATEPWAADQHLWLVGYGELGPKIVRFLSSYHREDRFHLVETVQDIDPEQIRAQHATVYVLDSNAESLEAFRALGAENAGMMADTVVTERAMWISEGDDGSATIVNVTDNGFKIWPNVVSEDSPLYQAMELIWQKDEEEVRAAAESLESISPDDFAATPEPSESGAAVSSAPQAADDGPWSSWMKNQQQANNPEKEMEDSLSDEDLRALVNSAFEDAEPQSAEASAETTDTAASGASAEAVRAPQAEDTEVTNAADTADTETGPAGKTQNGDGISSAPLALMGKPSLHGETGASASGKAAEAAALLHLRGSADASAVTLALWPDAETEGHAARTRRTRTAKPIKDLLGEAFTNADQWSLTGVATDVQRLTELLERDDISAEEKASACQTVETPLQGCAAWADEYRPALIDQLKAALSAATDHALEQDQFEVAKAARAAYKSL